MPVWDLDPAQRTEAEQLSRRWRRGGPERGFSMALSRFAGAEDPDCLIVQARDFVGELVAVLQFVPWVTMDCPLTSYAASPIWKTE